MKKSRRRAEGPLESDSVIAKAQVTPLLITQTAGPSPSFLCQAKDSIENANS